MPNHPVPSSPATRHLSLPPAGLRDLPCLACGGALDWYQPDPRSPERLLGICLDCGNWHVLDRVPDAADAVLVLVPGPRPARAP